MTETRHYHGDNMHDHAGGDRQHDHSPNYGKNIFWLIVLIVLAYVAFHVGHAEITRGNPPVCLLGAHWNIWSGWSCN